MSEENTGTLSRIPSVEHVSSDASNHAGIKSIKKSARENNSTLYTTYSYDTNVIKKSKDKMFSYEFFYDFVRPTFSHPWLIHGSK